MFGRVLGTTLAQVTRSIFLILLPLSLISLIAWATAGSATGNTGDPLRGALWLWLGFHQIPFDLVLPPAQLIGHLSYLPLGALVFPILAIRSGISRTFERLGHDASLLTLARILFAVEYSIAALLLAFFSATESVKPIWYVTPLCVTPLVLATAAMVGRRVTFGQALLYGSRAIAFLLGIASILLGISIFTHIRTVENLTTVLEPGIIGGLLLLLLNILYIPNAIVAMLGYFSGTGFAVGVGTIVSPLSFHLNTIPAFPLLGVLPTAKSPLALFGIVIVILTGALLASWTISYNPRVLIQSLVLATILTALIAYAASGALLTQALSAVGVSPWKFTFSVMGELCLGAFLANYLPRLSKRS